MALDGALLHLLKREIESVSLGARVDKIYQPAKEELILFLRNQNETKRLFLSCRAAGPRVHFTELPVENPKQPPMFCMLMRKHLGSAKLIQIRQPGLERVLFLDFEGINEMGDTVIYTLAAELMGRNSNIILIGPENTVIDAMRRVGFDKSTVRQILPGLHYQLPPPQERIALTEPAEVLIEKVKSCPKRESPLGEALGFLLEGASPLLCREIAYFACRGAETAACGLSGEEESRLRFFLTSIRQILEGAPPTPTMVLTAEGEPKDFSFVAIRQYGSSCITREYEDFSKLLDQFYGEKDASDRMRQKMGDLFRLVSNRTDRIARKLQAQEGELTTCRKRDSLKMFGDLLSANLYLLQKGEKSVSVPNFYEEGAPEISIPLDPRLTPTQNVQRYYKEYRKADTAEKKLTALMEESRKELEYLDTVFDLMTRAKSEAELAAIRAELAEEGYVRAAPGSRKKKEEEKLPPLRYRSSDGFLILSGRNNLQNDRITLRQSKNGDLWLHTQKIPGSHTVVVTEGKKLPDRTILEAAIIAATNSKARSAKKVPVDYTLIKNVKKQPGGKPGMVIYENFKTAIVDPDEALVASLAEPVK